LAILSTEIRQQFIEFFKEKNHHFIRSSSVVPHEDPTLLFTNAGMNQFKPYFLDLEVPENKRAVNSQKCIRVSGKHNDLEEVGVDDYHHTFFEMLGNWSFGDYYKNEAIAWAWELLTKVWKLDKNRLWVTIFEDDDESGEVWKEVTDIAPDRILKFGHKDNFWEMGDTGPCGPCTEIHYFTGEDTSKQDASGVNVLPEYREIWNLVFIQYNRDEQGKLNDLNSKHVDTGAGFERLVAILNGKSSNYETDLFIPLLDKICDLTGKDLNFKEGIPHRVISDHLRMLAFSLADGAMPGNEGRGYVLRRVLRRAARFGRMLEMKTPFIYKLTSILVDIMGDAFPELKEKQSHIEKVIQAEESSFNETLDRGLEIYAKLSSSLSKGDSIAGEDAFRLYDTFGFPLDLTELLAREDGFTVNVDEFNTCMEKQKDRARSAGKFKLSLTEADWTLVGEESPTEFTGYNESKSDAKLIKYAKSDNNELELVLDRTPFYAESGGQIGDKGKITAENFCFSVFDVQKSGNEYIHFGRVEEGSIEKVNSVRAEIDADRRNNIRRNHTATHLLHQALRENLGEHVQQAGSLVAPDLLRFDLTHYEQISSPQLREIEAKVNDIILQNMNVETQIKSYEDAKSDGAMSLFGEKYEDSVRVINVPGFSMELCGGTHVKRTGDIGALRITSESAIAAGVRRITAVTGTAVHDLLNHQEGILAEVKSALKCAESEIPSHLKAMLEQRKLQEKQLQQFKQSSVSSLVGQLVSNAKEVGSLKLVIHEMDDPGDLRELGDQFRQAFKSNGVSLIGTVIKNKPMVMCAVTDDLTKIVQAGTIVKEVGAVMGGGGGGKPHIATAGGSDVTLLTEALSHGEKLIKNLVD
jgi:alanyl-tRNA synthetase